MHESLVELAGQAPLCTHVATARGVLAESQDLARNAVEHNENPKSLVGWYSALVTDVCHSAAITNLCGGASIVLTGPVGRRDALPSSPIKWLTVGDGSGDSTALTRLLEDIGIYTEATVFGFQARSQEQWLAAIASASDSELAVFADAGTWFLDAVLSHQEASAALLRDVFTHRLPDMHGEDGLANYDVAVNIRKDLLYPIIAIARWAGVTAGSQAVSTPQRLADARQAGVLTDAQADYLLQAWDAGLQLQFRRFADRVHTHYTTASLLPPIQRSIYCASAQLVSDVLGSLPPAV